MGSHELLSFALHILCTEFLIFGMLYPAYTLTRRLLGKSTVALRWCATIAIGMWLATIIFHLLISFGCFTLPMALLSSGILLISSMIVVDPISVFFQSLHKDFIWLERMYRLHKRGPYGWFFSFFIIVALLSCLRTTLLPLLGWDSLTYHAVKAGMWVQNGRPITFHAPGGWSYQLSFWGGSEILSSWAMLSFHSDLLAGAVGAVIWLCLGLVLYSLGEALGIHSRFRWTAVAYVLYIPALWLSIGSGYVEPCLNLALMLGLLFAIHFLRHRGNHFLFLSFMALGVAGGTKVTSLPMIAIMAIILLFTGFTSVEGREDRAALVWWVLLGFTAASLAIGPWVITNIQQTGYPLPSIPVSLAGFKLGQINKALKWYQHREGLPQYQFLAEVKALARMFNLPRGPHLSTITIIPLFIFLITLFKIFHDHKRIAVLLIGTVGVTFLSIYHPDFSAVRILWASSTGRFLLPAVCPAIVASFLGFRPSSRNSNAYQSLLLWGTFIHIIFNAFWGWAFYEIAAISIEIMIVIALIVLISFLRKRSPKPVVMVGMMMFIPLLILPPLNIYRDRTRYQAASQSIVLHFVPRYWQSAARLVDTPKHPWKIAVTSGPCQNGDNWFTYFFLGRALQNQLFYIPVTEDGSIIDFGPDNNLERHSRFDSWLSRLHENGITYVMSFAPRSLELSWMEGSPELFTRLVGDGVSWGCYRVIPISVDNEIICDHSNGSRLMESYLDASFSTQKGISNKVPLMAG